MRKYLFHVEPISIHSTARILSLSTVPRKDFSASRPSGIAYRYLKSWLVLGGACEGLPEMRFVVAALSLAGFHYMMVVYDPALHEATSISVRVMLDRIVPHRPKMEWQDSVSMTSRVSFSDGLSRRLQERLAWEGFRLEQVTRRLQTVRTVNEDDNCHSSESHKPFRLGPEQVELNKSTRCSWTNRLVKYSIQ